MYPKTIESEAKSNHLRELSFDEIPVDHGNKEERKPEESKLLPQVKHNSRSRIRSE